MLTVNRNDNLTQARWTPTKNTINDKVNTRFYVYRLR